MSIKIDLDGKNVLITGANGSIGTEIVFKFLQAGANCLCVDKNLKELKKLTSKKKIFQKLTFLEIDFEKKNLKENFLKNFKKKIKIDILINNAGFSSSKKFLNYTLNDWRKTLEINLTSPFIFSQLVAKKFMLSGGSIINITSLAAEQGFPDNVAYVASKGGLKQLTKAMAIDLA